MAQPLFDEHPLEEYFRQTGEFAEPMPGGSSEFTPEPEVPLDLGEESSANRSVQLPHFVVQAVQLIDDWLRSSSSSGVEHNFAERFKYDVISSSLLASTLAAPSSTTRRTFSPEVPGRLDDRDGAGEDEASSPKANTGQPDASAADVHSRPPPSAGPQLSYVIVSIAVLALALGYHYLALVLLSSSAYLWYVVHPDSEKSDTAKQTLEALNDLISAGNVWDSAVNEAMMLIDNEERSIFYGPTSSQAPSSALRLVLQSSLQTTQQQCDNVRQLLSALTSPASLSHLAEMYAPSSPVRTPISFLESPRSPLASNAMRPFSAPSTTSWRNRIISSPGASPIDKRATWNGPYAALSLARSPTAHLLKRKQMNRRSDLTSLLPPFPKLSSVSAPVSPQAPSPAPKNNLQDVMEEGSDPAEELEEKGYFGAAALDMQRRRKSAGFEVFGAPPPSYASSADPSLLDPPLRSPIRASYHSRGSSNFSPTFSSSSRLTSVHTTRHPLSLSGLHLALQGAISAKRYTCSHLLALRFNEEEDESYWENVRSIMALLTSAFADASTRLVEALDDAEKRRIKDEHPTPPSGPARLGRDSSVSSLRSDLGLEKKRARSMAEMVSFAPMPSAMSRFGAHVDAIATALNDARDHLEECVAALRDASSRRQSMQLSESSGGRSAPGDVQDHPAFQAYDRLRKELGYALRECERGRERLLDIVAGPRSVPDGAEDEEEASPYTPGLKQDSGSESSEKGPISPNAQLDEHNHPGGDAGLGLELSLGRDGQDTDLDDATAHLLLTASSQHLPPPGVEQVYEAETSSRAPFTREKSKLTREERIRMAKARRASGLHLFSSSFSSADGAERYQPRGERGGPGGEVVQELKDVIWKVGEKRRKLSQQIHPSVAPRPAIEDGLAPRSVPSAAGLNPLVTEGEDRSESVREHFARPVVPVDTLRTELSAAVLVRRTDEGVVEVPADVS
ncbi:hypothetical protein BD414DRAFT_488809 [Trametes punicea]|nr:hypothetical protein BD414DRAFT_488809 [Trametes punicea]